MHFLVYPDNNSNQQYAPFFEKLQEYTLLGPGDIFYRMNTAYIPEAKISNAVVEANKLGMHTVFVFYIGTRLVGDRDNLIKEKLDSKKLHYSERKKYFKNRPNDLLVMNICSGEGWEVLCPFLNKPIPNVSFSKENIGKNYE